MAVSITFNFTTPQQNRIVAAKDIYNSGHDTTLTPKQYVLLLIKEGVLRELIQPEIASITATAESAEAAAVATIKSDLTGDA